MNKIIENKFLNLSMSTIRCTSKMNLACLKLCNEPIPSKLDEKRKAVSEYQKFMISKSKKLKEMKVKSIVRILHVLAAQLIASNEKSIRSIEIHCKKCLSKLYYIYQLLNSLSNKTGKNQYGWLNAVILALICYLIILKEQRN